MQRSDVMIEVELPFGVADGRGRRARRAVLRPINGSGELLGAEDPNPFRAALSLVYSCASQLGPFRDIDLDLGVLSSLLPIDRDFLLLQLNRLSFGDVRFHTVQCPNTSCGKRVDVRFDLSTLEPPRETVTSTGRLTFADGRNVDYRLPTAGDQIDMYGLATDAWSSELLERCVFQGSPSSLAPAEVPELTEEVKAAIVRAVLTDCAQYDTGLELQCVECGGSFRFDYDLVHSLLGELRASRSALLKEVHYLALYYHWSEAEILSLSNTRRREYLELLDEELTRSGQGVSR